jgi:hypothetical protein
MHLPSVCMEVIAIAYGRVDKSFYRASGVLGRSSGYIACSSRNTAHCLVQSSCRFRAGRSGNLALSEM